MLKVAITNRQKCVAPDRSLLRKLVRAAAPDAWDGCEVSVVVVNDAEIAEMNARFLGKPYPTDVLAFPFDGPDESDTPTVGEVVISAETAAAQAATRGLEARQELGLYVTHGVLHLAGYDDHDVADRRAMRRKERDVLASVGLRRD